jgi:Flp pilus assembly pilin Flp
MQMPSNTDISALPPKRRQAVRILAARLISDDGATVAVEYAVLGGLMALIAIGSFTVFGEAVSGLWIWLSGDLGEAMTR